MVNSDLNCCICLKIKKYLMSLPHLPTSANFHQDIIWHIQEVHQWRVRLMHSLILVWFLSSFQLPKRLNYVEYGKENSDVIILLHGGGLSWWNYKEVAERLQTDYHVVLPI